MLRRLRGTPMPPAAYFLGKIWLVLVTGLLETAILLPSARAVRRRSAVGRRQTGSTFAWVFVLGLTGCALLGIAVSWCPTSGQSASAVVVLPFLVLQFISGVFIAIDTHPPLDAEHRRVFPLKWMCQGLAVGVPAGRRRRSWSRRAAGNSAAIALVLGAWCVGGLVLCLLTFRWKGRRDG